MVGVQTSGAQQNSTERTQLKIISWRLVIACFLAACFITFITTWILVAQTNSKNVDEAKIAAVKISAIRTGLSVGAGAGGAMALLLAARRQWLGERSQAHSEEVSQDEKMDATERRITDLYGKAVDQLGSEKAAVRIGGLIALERLAQANPGHRQTIADVICAYLRMPFSIPSSVDLSSATPHTLENEITNHEQQQEIQVRLTAQTVLRRHLMTSSKDSGDFWPDLHLDLTGASLLIFNLSNCELGGFTFAHATFVGTARFNGCKSARDAIFRSATFHGFTDFEGCNFAGQARFDDARFVRSSSFIQATFDRACRFDKVAFEEEVSFKTANFHDIAVFDDAKFLEVVIFTDGDFIADARFLRVEFAGQARFLRARFRSTVTISSTRFEGDAIFRSTQFESRVRIHNSQFLSATSFRSSRFTSGALFRNVLFHGEVNYRDAALENGVSFNDTTFEQLAKFTAPQGNFTLNFHKVLFNGPVQFLRADDWSVRFWECSLADYDHMLTCPYGWRIASEILPSGRHAIARFHPPLSLP
jgi:uncharacterized protein YjbI with pentapeptide repeats